MRLTADEVAAIKEAARETFGPDAVVRLFGSRLDDCRRGGDIDLHVQLLDEPRNGAVGAFRRLLERRVGEREYDIVLSRADHAESAISVRAVATGVIL